MVRTIAVESLSKIKKIVPKIEAKTKVRISFGSGFVIVRGKEVEEFVVEKIIQAVDFGFDMEDALLLLNTDYLLEFVDIKEHTHRKNLHDVRSRVIGTSGKALNTIENLTGAILVVKDNSIGIIAEGSIIANVHQALESIIRGAKHGNVFSALERGNRSRKKEAFFGEDLGLKEDIKKKFVEE